MNTLEELNNKWWYRLVKVLFIIVVSLCAIIIIAVVFDENKPKKVGDFRIDCMADYTNGRTSYANDEEIYIYHSGTGSIYGNLTNSTKQKLREVCDLSNEEAEQGNAAARAYVSQQFKLGTSEAVMSEYIENNIRPYKITEVSRIEGSYFLVGIYIWLGIAILLIVAEIIRRVFYYIVLGKINPR